MQRRKWINRKGEKGEKSQKPVTKFNKINLCNCVMTFLQSAVRLIMQYIINIVLQRFMTDYDNITKYIVKSLVNS